MSVIFNAADPGPILSHVVHLWCDGDQVAPADAAEAKLVLDTHNSRCEECRSYGGCFLNPVYDAPVIQMSNTNAARLLDSLGYGEPDSELFGSAPAAEFLGRILIALALEPADEGRPTVTEGNVVMCGTEVGYIQKRLQQLHALASWSVDHNTEIHWG